MRPGRPRSDAINPDRPDDILGLLLAEILEDEVELVAHLVAHDPADADPARLGQRLEPCGDIDAVAINVVLLDDDIAEIDADAELDAALQGDAVIVQCHVALQLDRAAHRIYHARELDQQPITGRFHNAAAMLGDLGVRYFAAQRRQGRVRALLVLAHQPRIAGDIGRQYRRQPALDPLPPGVHDGDATAISPFAIAPERRARKETVLGPILCAVIDAHDFDGFCLDPIHDDKGKWCEHELASACYPAVTAAIGELP